MFLVQCALCVLHITRRGLDNNPCSTDGSKEGPWNGAERVEVAAIDNPANRVYGDGGESRLDES